MSVIKGKFWTEIDSIRGILALTVAIGHSIGTFILNDYTIPIQHSPDLRSFILKLLVSIINGQTAVIFFFAISGFVLAAALEKLPDLSIRSQASFYIARIVRIYPAHIICLLLYVPYVIYIVKWGSFNNLTCKEYGNVAAWLNYTRLLPLHFSELIDNLLLAKYSINQVTWSLQVEVYAIPFLPIFYLICKRFKYYIILPVLAILMATTSKYYGRAYSDFLFIFFMGTCTYFYKDYLINTLLRNFSSSKILFLSLLILILPALVFAGRPPREIMIESFASCAIIALVTSRQSTINSRLHNSVLRFLGKLSYSFYLYHHILLALVVRFIFSTVGDQWVFNHQYLAALSGIFISISLSLVVAYLSYSFVEKPMKGMIPTLIKSFQSITTLKRAPATS